MKNYLQFYIDGKWVDPVVPNKMGVINPSTEETFAAISLGSAADVDLAVAAAKKAFESYSKTSAQERLELLEQILAVYTKRYDEVVHAISQEMGAPLWLSKAAQAAMGIGHFKQAVKVLKDFKFLEHQGTTAISYEPIGVVGMITPWNWPINQIACKVAPALAAGCTAVLKPSEIAPINAIIFADILHEAGVPAGVFNLVNGDGASVGNAISSHKDIDMVTFTGSTRAGIAVAQSAAPTVKRVAQELGGKSANIILDDADLEKAVNHAVKFCFFNSGQSCNAPTRLLVPEQLHDEIVAIAKVAAQNTLVGDPMSDGDRQIGPVVSQAQYDKIQNLIQAALDEGSELVVGGTGRPDGIEKGYYIKPTIFANVNNSMLIAKEEVFGPVLSILPYKTEQEAIQIANDTVYGLSGYVQSGNLERARNVALQLRTGNVHINGAPSDVAAPFGGYKQSGNGRERGEFGFREYLEVKAVMGYEPIN